MAQTEAQYQLSFIKKVKSKFEGCVAIKNDPGYQQGMLDWTVLYGNNWVALEIKRDKKSSHQPNQDYFVKKLNEMSYAAFVYPENEEEVLLALERAFAS